MTQATAPGEKWRTVRTLLIFSLVGPVAGLAVVLLYMLYLVISAGAPVEGCGEGCSQETAQRMSGAVGVVGAFVALATAPLGVVPGLATGFLAALLRKRRTNRLLYCGLCALVGAATGSATYFLLLYFVDMGVLGAMLGAAAGGGAGLVCALLTLRR